MSKLVAAARAKMGAKYPGIGEPDKDEGARPGMASDGDKDETVGGVLKRTVPVPKRKK